MNITQIRAGVSFEILLPDTSRRINRDIITQIRGGVSFEIYINQIREAYHTFPDTMRRIIRDRYLLTRYDEAYQITQI